MKKASRILDEVREVARSIDSWADLANALYHPENGLITKAFPTRKEREAFIKSEEYEKIRELLAHAVDTFGLVEGAIPTRGQYVVRLPHSLHTSLEREAEQEGVSLDQLVVAKLAAPLSVLAGKV